MVEELDAPEEDAALGSFVYQKPDNRKAPPNTQINPNPNPNRNPTPTPNPNPSADPRPDPVQARLNTQINLVMSDALRDMTLAALDAYEGFLLGHAKHDAQLEDAEVPPHQRLHLTLTLTLTLTPTLTLTLTLTAT